MREVLEKMYKEAAQALEEVAHDKATLECRESYWNGRKDAIVRILSQLGQDTEVEVCTCQDYANTVGDARFQPMSDYIPEVDG